MCCSEHKVFCLVHEDLFFLGELTPEEEYHVFFGCRDFGDHGIGEFGPADLGVAHGFVGAYGQRGVEEKDALFRPVGEVAMAGDGHADVLVQLFEDVDKGGGRWNTFLDGETQAVGLAGAVVGVLSQQDDLDLVEGGCVEGVEDKATGGIDRFVAHLFVFEQGGDLGEVGFAKFLFEYGFPAFFYFYVHSEGCAPGFGLWRKIAHPGARLMMGLRPAGPWPRFAKWLGRR